MEQIIYILWDASHIWGLMAWRAVTGMGLTCRLVKAEEITHGLLSCKPPAVLLAPGGTARLKARALGDAGMAEVRAYVAGGGNYLGFCGGAGLGLTGEQGMALCPWTRAAYSERMQHLVSGHVLVRVCEHSLSPCAPPRRLSLPVWWPGRFAPHMGDGVEVLARYESPDRDLCLADIPLHALPRDIFSEWREVYGVDMRADFLKDQPCIITGEHGKGRYVLSYSHLETPDSPEANLWLAHLVRCMGLAPACADAPPWDVDQTLQRWPLGSAPYSLLHTAWAGSLRLMALGAEHNLLFCRTPWLRGWRTGIPGAALNNLHATLGTALSLEPNDAALCFWRGQEDRVRRILPPFLKGVEGYLLAERLATTLAASLPEAVDRHILNERRETLFGRPMQGGGLYQELLDVADELVFLLGNNARPVRPMLPDASA